MMNDIEVRVRLLDELSKPARSTAEAIERLAKSGSRLKEISGGVRNLRGLSRAFASLGKETAGGDAAANRLARFTGAVSALARNAGDIDAAGKSISGLSRSIGRLAALGDKIDQAASSLKTLKGAMSDMPSGEASFVGQTNAALREMLDLQRRAMAGMRGLGRAGGSGGGGGRRGMGGGSHGGGVALAFNAPGLTSFAKSAITDAEDVENALTQVRLAGLPEADVQRIKDLAQSVATSNPLSTYAENLRGLLEARVALSGDLDEATKLFPTTAKYAAVFAHAGGANGDQVKAAKDAVYSALRAGELRNIANDPGRMDSLLSGMMGANIASDGRITPKQWASNIQYGRSAGLNLNDTFTNLAFPFLIQELTNAGKGAHGGQAGNALMSAYATIVQGRIRKQDVPEWIAAGQLQAGDVDKDGHVKPGAVKGTAQFMEDPRAFVQAIIANFHTRGINSQGDILKHLSALFGNRTAAGLMDLMALQDSRLSGFMAMERMAGSGDPRAVDEKLGMIQRELATSTTELSHSFELLRVTAIAPFLPRITEATRGLADFAAATQGFVAKWIGTANDPNNPKSGGLSWGMIGTLGGAGLFGLAKLITKAPAAATILGQLGVASQGGVVAGFLSRATIKETVASISEALTTTTGAALTRSLGKGVLGGLIYEAGTWAIHKMVGSLRDTFVSPERQYRSDRFNEQNILQKWGWFGGSSNPMNPRFAPPSGTPLDPTLDSKRPIAGARASGGPVARGLTYLVGERGPELFTPGLSGAITSNRVAGMIGRGDDDRTPKAIRSLAFALAESVDGIARAVSGLQNRSAFAGDGAGLSSANLDRGGRRGFMARAGHFGGGRRAFMARNAIGDHEPASGGPRVFLGQMRAGGRGSYAKFDAKAPAIVGALMTKYGLSKEQAAGIVGNLGHESARFSAYHEGGKAPGRGGVGWAQWTGSRRRAFERWTSARHLNPTSDEASWRYLTEGDPEMAKAVAAVRRTHNSHNAMVAFERSFERAGVKAYGSRDALARRALGFNPVAGITDPAMVPDVLKADAKRRLDRERAGDAARNRDAGSRQPVMHVSNVIHVHAQPHHDTKQIAAAVHQRFNESVKSQLNDGAYA